MARALSDDYTRTISNKIGLQLRAWREDAGLTQEDVATAGRKLGLLWSRNAVAAIELGRREISLAEYLLVRGGRFEEREVAALFGGERAVDTVSVGGTSFSPPISAGLDHNDPLVREWLDSERKAAHKFGVTVKKSQQTAVQLWGRVLTDERNRILYARLAGGQPEPRRLQALRGHVTRELLAELGRALKESRKRR